MYIFLFRRILIKLFVVIDSIIIESLRKSNVNWEFLFFRIHHTRWIYEVNDTVDDRLISRLNIDIRRALALSLCCSRQHDLSSTA